MADQNSNINPADPEMAKLRNAVLKWIEEKKETAQIKPALPKPAVLPPTKPAKPVKKSLVLPPVKKSIKPNSTPPPTKEPVKPIKPRIAKPPPEKKEVPLLPFKTKTRSKSIFLKIFILTVLVLIIFSFWLYLLTPQNHLVGLITKIVPYPAVLVDWQPIYYSDWQKEVLAVNNFYLKQKVEKPDLTRPDLKQIKSLILQRMIEEKLTDRAAAKYQVNVSAEEIDAQTQTLAKEIGSQSALAKQIKQLYDWDLTDFQNEIIRPFLLKNKLNLVLVADSEYNRPALNTIQKISGEIRNSQKFFAEAAETYSQDITGVQGGDLGYFGRGEMMPEIEEAAFNLEAGEVSEIIKSRLGYHLLQLTEKLTDEQGNLTKIRASQILILGKNLDDLLKELKTKAKIWQLVRI